MEISDDDEEGARREKMKKRMRREGEGEDEEEDQMYGRCGGREGGREGGRGQGREVVKSKMDATLKDLSRLPPPFFPPSLPPYPQTSTSRWPKPTSWPSYR